MLPQATAIAGVAIWFTGMAVLIICWRHLKSQELFQIKTRSTHYMPELSIAVRSGKAYHKATFEHVTDRAVHPVVKSGNLLLTEFACQKHTHLNLCARGSRDVSSAHY